MSTLHNVYVDKENLDSTTRKGNVKGQVKPKTKSRKVFGNVGNTIQSRLPSASKLKKEKTEPAKNNTLLASQTKVPIQNATVDANVGAEIWPEIEHMPTPYEPEDTYEDIWPIEEQRTAEDFFALKFLKPPYPQRRESLSPLFFPEELLPFDVEIEDNYAMPCQLDELLLSHVPSP